MSDKEQFGRNDYWQPPEEFEETRKGDCDCFALWAWREVMALGLEARFVIGRAGRYREGHAWVQFSKDGKDFLLEPTAARLGNTLPRLSTLRYHPKFSVAWNGTDISFYSHSDKGHEPPLLALIASVPDWIFFWMWAWVMRIVLLPINVLRRVFANRWR